MGSVHYDVERLGSILSDITRYFDDLDSMHISSIQDLHDKRNFYAVSMLLLSLLNRIFDLGSEIGMAHNLGNPVTYREIFVQLQKNGIIDNELAKEMTGMVTYRNLLSHESHGITEENLYMLVSSVGHIRAFVHQMQKKVRDGN